MAKMIRNAYEVDPMVCPKCGGTMKIIAFITEYAVADCNIDHLKLTFVATKPPPSHVFEQVALIAAEESGEYFYRPNILFGLDFRIFRCH